MTVLSALENLAHYRSDLMTWLKIIHYSLFWSGSILPTL